MAYLSDKAAGENSWVLYLFVIVGTLGGEKS